MGKARHVLVAVKLRRREGEPDIREALRLPGRVIGGGDLDDLRREPELERLLEVEADVEAHDPRSLAHAAAAAHTRDRSSPRPLVPRPRSSETPGLRNRSARIDLLAGVRRAHDDDDVYSSYIRWDEGQVPLAR